MVRSSPLHRGAERVGESRRVAPEIARQRGFWPATSPACGSKTERHGRRPARQAGRFGGMREPEPRRPGVRVLSVVNRGERPCDRGKPVSSGIRPTDERLPRALGRRGIGCRFRLPSRPSQVWTTAPKEAAASKTAARQSDQAAGNKAAESRRGSNKRCFPIADSEPTRLGFFGCPSPTCRRSKTGKQGNDVIRSSARPVIGDRRLTEGTDTMPYFS